MMMNRYFDKPNRRTCSKHEFLDFPLPYCEQDKAHPDFALGMKKTESGKDLTELLAWETGGQDPSMARDRHSYFYSSSD